MLRRALGAAQAQAVVPRIAINISARTVHAGRLPERVGAALEATGFAPSGLELELTETALLSATARTREEFQVLREMGVRIALDDFGTGWSSLAHLREFPVTTIKIDRSFVSGYSAGGPSEAIVRSLIGLGGNMSIEVVAEGVETAAQADWLTELGCDLLQGYYFGRPGAMGGQG
jgi:EAL domain-containing protein (putative c-di-GMP-specific phosphodiesterase class I)